MNGCKFAVYYGEPFQNFMLVLNFGFIQTLVHCTVTTEDAFGFPQST